MSTFRRLGHRFVLDRHAVGYWYWEALEPPAGTAEVSSHLDEIWVASEFVAGSLRAASTVPVHVVPPAVDLEVAAPLDRAALGVRTDGVCFLTMASVNSVLERKNPFGTLEAFRRAFAGHVDTTAVLIMKLSGLDLVPLVRAELRRRIGDLPVVVIDRPMARAELRSLVATSDVVVSLHRAEGFGLPLAEAMAAGRATIATAWSGNADFTVAGASFPVPYEVVELERDLGPYRRGMHWAEPDLDAAAEAMRTAATDVEHRREIAAAGQRLIRQRYDARSLAVVVRSHVERIGIVIS
jgi:glycosyltransferase involved in cell wall biosynthesis